MSTTAVSLRMSCSANCVLRCVRPKIEMALDFVVFSADTARTGGFRPHPFNLSLSIALLYGKHNHHHRRQLSAAPPTPRECSSLCRDCSTRCVCVRECVSVWCELCVFFIFFLLVCLLCGMWLYVIFFAANLLSSAHTAHIRMERNVATHKN